MNNVTLNPSVKRNASGFSLVELLVVIGIIGILASIILPVLGNAKQRAKIAKAKLEMRDFENALAAYKSDYKMFPMSPAVQAASSANADFTYGDGSVVLNGTGTERSNEELVAILSDWEFYQSNNNPTVNQNHALNFRKKDYLQVNQLVQPGDPGHGTDAVWRDPWGNPYIVTLDLNYDDQVMDAFYRLQAVSQQNGSSGYMGTVNNVDAGGNGNNFSIRKSVAVWSFGPDGKADATAKANGEGANGKNSDNILSWFND